MKTRTLLIAAAIILFVTGCVVTSFHPLYTEDDLVFNKNLIGTWYDEENAEWNIGQYFYSKKTYQEKFKKEVNTPNDKIPHNSYLIHYFEKHKEDSTDLHMHMIKLGKNYYLDFYGEDFFINDNFFTQTNLINVHTFAKVEITDSVVISWFNADWLNDLIQENKIKIKHEKSDDGILLTASTKELQKFIMKYGESDKPYDEDMLTILKRKKQ